MFLLFYLLLFLSLGCSEGLWIARWTLAWTCIRKLFLRFGWWCNLELLRILLSQACLCHSLAALLTSSRLIQSIHKVLLLLCFRTSRWWFDSGNLLGRGWLDWLIEICDPLVLILRMVYNFDRGWNDCLLHGRSLFLLVRSDSTLCDDWILSWWLISARGRDDSDRIV